MSLTTKIVDQRKYPWGWETTLEFYSGKTLVKTRIVSGKPKVSKLNFLTQKVQESIDNPIVAEKLYTQAEVDQLIAHVVKEVLHAP